MPASSFAATIPAAGLSYREYLPPADLTSVFTCLWVKDSAGQPAHSWRTIPNGHSELVWHSQTCELTLAGPGLSFTLSDDTSTGFTVGMRVRPEHSAWFAGMPANEVVGRSVPLTTMTTPCRSRWLATSSALAQAHTPRAALSALVEAIRTADLSPRAPDPVVRRGLSHLRGRRRVGEVGQRVHYSDREVRRRFRHTTGLAPKTMQKVLRFQLFLALVTIEREPAISLGIVAARCGYADQAHLTRECVAMSGLTPRRLLLELASSCWPHHDHAASFAHVAAMGLAPGQAR